jgi:hypothetical protein
VAKAPKVEAEGATTPPRIPDVPPPYSQAVGSTWLIEAIMQLQQSISKLETKVDHLTAASDKQGTKLDSISHRMYAAGAVLAVVLSILGFFLNKIWDGVFMLLKAAH